MMLQRAIELRKRKDQNTGKTEKAKKGDNKLSALKM